MERSYNLVWANFLTASVISVVLFFISFAVGMAGALVPQPYIQQALGVFIQATMSIFYAVTMVVFYYSARCGTENFDLELLASDMAPSTETDDEDNPFKSGNGSNWAD